MGMNSVNFIESEKSLKHELRSIYRSPLLPMSSWCYASPSNSYAGGSGLFFKFCSFYKIQVEKTRIETHTHS